MYSFTVSEVPAASSVCCGQSSRVVGRYDLVFVGGLVFVPPEVPPSVGSVVRVTVTFGDGLAEGVPLLAVFSARSLFFCCVPSTMPTPVPSTARKITAMITAPVAERLRGSASMSDMVGPQAQVTLLELCEHRRPMGYRPAGDGIAARIRE